MTDLAWNPPAQRPCSGSARSGSDTTGGDEAFSDRTFLVTFLCAPRSNLMVFGHGGYLERRS